MKNKLPFLKIIIFTFFCVFFPQYSLKAQLIPDSTLGNNNSLVTPNQLIRGTNADLIEGGASINSNLFHSFTEFHVNDLQRVYFANPVGIENILTRVTGNNLSNILGTLGVDGNANLFLINPHGIYFGENAKLDISGSFLATTASELVGENGLINIKEADKETLLSINPNVFFNANNLQNNQGNITNQGNLAVGNDLILDANNLNLSGSLQTGGNLTLQASNNITMRDQLEKPFLAISLGDLLIQGNNLVDIFVLNDPESGLYSGGNLFLKSANPVSGDAHFYSGGNFSIKQLDGNIGNFFSLNDPVIRSQGDVRFFLYQGTSLHILAGGSVDINTVFITGADSLSNTINPTSTPNLANVTLSDGTSLTINGNQRPTLDLRAGMKPDAIGNPLGTRGGGFFLFSTPVNNPVATNANITIGDIFINSPNGTILLTNKYEPNRNLSGGAITINGNGFLGIGGIVGGGFYKGDSSDVFIDSRERINITGNIFAGNEGFINGGFYSGDGGDIKLIADQDIYINNGSNIGSAGLLGGNVLLKSSENIYIEGSQVLTNTYTSDPETQGGSMQIIAKSLFAENGTLLSTTLENKGNAGDLSINTTDSVIFDGVDIFGNPSGVASNVLFDAKGNGGNISITTGFLKISNNGILSASIGGEGTAGNIFINATNAVIFENESFAVSQLLSEAKGNAGNIFIQSDSLEVTNKSQLAVDTFGEGNAGDIIINTNNYVMFDQESRAVSQVEQDAKGNSGNVSINTNSLEVTNNSFISATTFGEGNSGKVILEADHILFDRQSVAVSRVAPSAIGNAEGINITTKSLKVINGAFLAADTLGLGNAGIIDIDANNIVFDGVVNKNFISGAYSEVATEAIGNAEGINITTDFLQVINGAQLSAKTDGIGNAGDIIIHAHDIVFDGVGNNNASFPSGATTGVQANGLGMAGGIDITTDSLKVMNGALLDASTFGEGNAGSIIIEANHVLFDGKYKTSASGAFSAVTSGSIGDAGGLVINADLLEVINGARLSASTFGEGNAGGVSITTASLELTNDAIISASTRGKGDAGDIKIETSILNVFNGGEILAFTKGNGDGGKIMIDATNSVNLGQGVQDFAPVISVETSNIGKAGNIIINTPSLNISDTARITATATETATNLEGGGSININADTMNLAGIVGIFAETQGQAPAGTLTLQPYQHHSNLDIILFKGSKISASTSGSGNGGDLIVTAPNTINIMGTGTLAVETSGSGDAGNILITSNNLNLTDGVTLSASTLGGGKGGNIKLIVANDLNLTNANILASTSPNSTGKGGNINIDPIHTNLHNSRIAVDSKGKGTGGDIFLQSNFLNLINNSTISAQTFSSDGGNITLQISDILFFKEGGNNITATAGLGSTGGNGGNINIFAPWIISLPNQDNNITAEAFEGKGGNINITTNALFGIAFTGKNMPISNDITASSQFGINGSVIINTPAVDPTSGLIDLPTNLVDADSLFGRDPCALENGQIAGGSSFVIIGKGGLPPNPNQEVSNINGIVDLISLNESEQNHQNVSHHQPSNLREHQPIIQQAQGWGITKDGTIMITAESINITPQTTGFSSPNCHSFK
jgi:filamentous hemagglutinin family protein